MISLADHSHLLVPQWSAPANVGAVVTLRTGGVSQPPYDSLNLGDHVGDHPQHVASNRQLLADWIGLPLNRLQWLKQVHGTRVVEAHSGGEVIEADAVTTSEAGLGCVVMTADCLPVFFCDAQGSRVAVAHAGWRGLVSGVLEATLTSFAEPEGVQAWLGPAIGPEHFEVGSEVRDAFLARDSGNAVCFQPNPHRPTHWFADIYQLARIALRRQGVNQISGGQYCTFVESHHFYSYRRDGQTGRMASVIWRRG